MEGIALASLLGAVVGLVLALTGAGGGVLAVPLLIFGLGLSIQQAAPIALLAVGVAAFTGAVLGWREGVLRYRAAGLIGSVGLLLAPLGVWLAHQLPARPLMLAFSGVLAWTAWRMSRTGPARAGRGCADPVRPCRVDPKDGRLHWTRPCAWVLGGTGALSGVLSGLLGVGGGFVIVPALARYTDLDARSIATTSLGVIGLVSTSGLLAAQRYGALDPTVLWPFGAGATLALMVGRRLARHLPAQQLRQAFAGVSLAVAGLMAARALGLLSL